jgi:hypothetical protein
MLTSEGASGGKHKNKGGMKPLTFIPPKNRAEERFVMVYLQGSDSVENALPRMNVI